MLCTCLVRFHTELISCRFEVACKNACKPSEGAANTEVWSPEGGDKVASLRSAPQLPPDQQACRSYLQTTSYTDGNPFWYSPAQPNFDSQSSPVFSTSLLTLIKNRRDQKSTSENCGLLNIAGAAARLLTHIQQRYPDRSQNCGWTLPQIPKGQKGIYMSEFDGMIPFVSPKTTKSVMANTLYGMW